MKPKRLSELRALLAQPEFQDWWEKLRRARDEARGAQERYDELLSQVALTEFRAELTQKNAIDTLYRAGECEDAAANLLVEATGLENRSFQAVSDFEEQRYKVSELWYRLGATEKSVEERRDEHQRQPSKRSASELELAERALRALSDEYERETARKDRLWDEVERLWAKSAEVSLLVSEQRARGKNIRREAEALFALAEERKQKSKDLRAQAEASSAALEAAKGRAQAVLEQAREKLGCAAGHDFLFFRHRDNQKLAFCIPLVEDLEGYNVEVKPLSIYCVDRQRGVAFLEPARAEPSSLEEGDRRFEEYFLTGRKGEARPSSRARE